jgi:PBP1b-binding outer membrane lipoprotein LpoB
MTLKWTIALAATLMLAGCNSAPDAPPPNTANLSDEVPLDSIPPETLPTPANSAPVENIAAPPEFSDEQQIQDDAEATGMTSRLPDESATPAGGAQDHAGHGSGNAASN